MVVKNINQLEENIDSTYDRKAEVKAFNDPKAGVKGLVESLACSILATWIALKPQLVTPNSVSQS
ncbi:hypothetical protein JHK82_023433 [Glycine max]|uniref:Uncharacterized protein n=1 Tax=Glycine soja TaxID=3848 RepID=A0A0B2PTX0_GLYSO|nr:hypothetical protein JHK85_023969 [Glycine max]KAG5027581.1 hypothetical protein JHK86_023495 [Glycine max]KAG5138702.1 hypothetical protein JHK82_023433 [Glycine max]KHN11002.1 hypothetical protein glysoja_026737 [Glycine soja]